MAEDAKAQQAVKAPKKTHYIVEKGKSFRDINDFNKIHVAGDDVSDFAADRIQVLVDLKIIAKTEK